MKYRRSSGILLHPTSLPGPFGIGDLGKKAYQWVDFLAEAGIGFWEVLPLNPTGYGDSPYQSFSAFAGNTLLISPELLVEDSLLSDIEINDHPHFTQTKVDYKRISPWKEKILQLAFSHIKEKSKSALYDDFQEFQQINEYWLSDYALYMAIKDTYKKVAWNKWPDPLRLRQNDAINQFRIEHKKEIESHAFRQFLFFKQWETLVRYAHSKNVRIIGDLPIFVAFDSADVWTNPDLFILTNQLKPKVVAGVPPDYFSPTGQLWGNPHYRWDTHKRTKYHWWFQRFKAALQMVDLVRLDHFRGFAGFWEVPAGNLTAEHGRWVQGPGIQFFKAVQKAMGELPFIAEDLGVISPDVIRLRERFDLPGMKILQFGFSSDAYDPFLPHNYPINCVAYTGTHDNATVLDWYRTAPEKERSFCLDYLHTSGKHISWDMIHAAWASVAILAIAPMQDFLEIGRSGRMNYPGRCDGNWVWRMPDEYVTPTLISRIKELNRIYLRDKITITEKPPLAEIIYQKRN